MPICNSLERIVMGIVAVILMPFFLNLVLELTGTGIVVEGFIKYFAMALTIIVWLGWDAYQGTIEMGNTNDG
ncbi:MAG: hypothetical protein P8179_23565 [Candidatus Thiodiazotropha sp.]